MNDLQTQLNSARALMADDPVAAASALVELLERAPDAAPGWALLAEALRRQDKPKEAIAAERSAAKLFGRHPDIMAATGALHRRDLRQAEVTLRRRLAAAPADPAALFLLAEVPAALGLAEAAVDLLGQTIAAAPSFDEAYLRRATFHQLQGKADAARADYDTLLGWDAGHRQALLGRAALLAQTGDYEAAQADNHAFTAAFPTDTRGWIALGNLLKTIGDAGSGDAAGSEGAFRHALTIDPDCAEAWWSLSNLKRVRFSADDKAAMEAALARVSSDADATHLNFALGQHAENEGRADAAFDHYERGNRLYRASRPFSRQATTDEARRTVAWLERQKAKGGIPATEASGGPIFIIGLPRAGSTLIEQILASHPLVEGTSELPYGPILVQSLMQQGWQAHRLPYPDMLDRLTQEQQTEAGARYLEAAATHRHSDRPWFVDKLPDNWLNIAFILACLPGARIVDARRDPLACGWSNFKQLFAAGHLFSYDLGDIGFYYRTYTEVMEAAYAAAPDRIVRVQHEELVADPEPEIRRLLEALGLPFYKSCLTPHETARAVRTASAEQVRRPISADGLNAWRPFEPWLGPLKDALRGA